MNFNQILDWLAAKREAFATLGVIVTISATIIGSFWAWEKSNNSGSFQAPALTEHISNGKITNAPMTARAMAV